MILPWCVKCSGFHFLDVPCAVEPDVEMRTLESEIAALKTENVLLKEKLDAYETKREKRNTYQRNLMRKRAARGQG